MKDKKSISIFSLIVIGLMLMFTPGCDDDTFKYFLTLEVAPAGTGTVTGAGEYAEGESVSISATANQGYEFVNWTDEQDLVIGTTESLNYTMPSADVTLKANFTVEIAYGGGVTDIDGNVYQTVIIGNQEWMAENLKTTQLTNGTPIPLVPDNADWQNLSTPGYCWYINDAATMGNTYGAIYNWYALETGNLCPSGWHEPTDAEWTTLTDYLGGENIAGGKLKEAGTAHWNTPNTDATNETGFSALPGGWRSLFGGYNDMGYWGGWWSASEHDASTARYRYIYWNEGAIYSLYDNTNPDKRNGFSVRCIKD